MSILSIKLHLLLQKEVNFVQFNGFFSRKIAWSAQKRINIRSCIMLYKYFNYFK